MPPAPPHLLSDLQVMVDVDDKNEWRECIDIGGVRLPTGYFFGASAATGDLSGGCGEVWGGRGLPGCLWFRALGPVFQITTTSSP